MKSLFCATIQLGLLSCRLNFPPEYNNGRGDSTCKCTCPPFQSPDEENTDFQKVTLFWDKHVIHFYSLILGIIMCSVYNPVLLDPYQILGRKRPFYCLPTSFCFTVCTHHRDLLFYTQIFISLKIETIIKTRATRYYCNMNKYMIN